MRYSELKRLLKKNGCYMIREGHGHEIWYSPISDRQFPVGRHGNQEIPTGTARGILKDAGLD